MEKAIKKLPTHGMFDQLKLKPSANAGMMTNPTASPVMYG